MGNFFDDYFAYIGDSEIPDIYNRWVAIGLIGSVLGRQFYLPFIGTPIYPNQYIMLMGQPATRKSTAIGMGSKILRAIDYKMMAPERMSRQSCLDEVYRLNLPENRFGIDPSDIDAMLDLPGEYPNEMTVHAGEFIDFIGQNDKDYLMLFTTLWDNLPRYANPKVSKSSITVPQPTINLIGGATSENLNMAFPQTMMDTGTLSRFLFIHANPTDKKILFPDPDTVERRFPIAQHVKKIGEQVKGAATFEPDAKELLQFIYNDQRPLDDPRFAHYAGRRLPHLLKLCLIHAAADLTTEITARHVLQAHTVLVAAEHNMPLALGHFGRTKQSVTQHAILEYLETQRRPVGIPDLYAVFSSDFTHEKDFSSMMLDMYETRKIDLQENKTTGKKEVVVHPRTLPKWALAYIEPSLLTAQERANIGVA